MIEMDALKSLLLDGTGLDLWSFFTLNGAAFLGGFITASMGLGGGLLVIATMALLLPATAVIPLHGVVQWGSNIGRAALLRSYVIRHILPAFFIGTVLGISLGAPLAVSLPIAFLQFILGLFVLYSTWAPKIQASNPGKKAFFILGAVGAFTTMFVGATGPLVAPFASAASKVRQEFVATHAALMTIQHTFKLIGFGLLGFAFGPYVPLLAGMLVLGFIGTWLGRFLLHRLPEHVFRIVLKTILTGISLRLLYDAARAYFGI